MKAAENKARRVDYYKVLEVDYTASESEIRKKFKKLVAKWHPDKHKKDKDKAEAKFKEIQEAYGVLSDYQKRQLYDDGVDLNDPAYRNRDFNYRKNIKNLVKKGLFPVKQ